MTYIKDDGSLDQDRNSLSKWSDSGCILGAEPTGLTDRVDVGMRE